MDCSSIACYISVLLLYFNVDATLISWHLHYIKTSSDFIFHFACLIHWCSILIFSTPSLVRLSISKPACMIFSSPSHILVASCYTFSISEYIWAQLIDHSHNVRVRTCEEKSWCDCQCRSQSLWGQEQDQVGKNTLNLCIPHPMTGLG